MRIRRQLVIAVLRFGVQTQQLEACENQQYRNDNIRYAGCLLYTSKSMEMNSVMATEIVAAEVEHIVLPQIVSIKPVSYTHLCKYKST